ncbi:MAG: AEC family transporter [Methanobrevibacter sp.]|uniref:AEC family transporter n=1 Tax=Methanobrevibacter sp. TaxID=66852 RepID=UPI0026E08327|nr:AEC family transporter [Methanobrevibacter sp.]MDO5848640.1 AEC family transporter [Methanobrevibacter sp.]
MDAIITTILSISILIALGYIFKKINLLSEKDVTPFNNLVMNLLMPCMIFSALYSADLNLIPKLGVLPFVIVGSSCVCGVISYIILKSLHFDDRKVWSIVVTVMIANTAFMGYPVNLGIFGNSGFLRAIFSDLGTLFIFIILSFVLILKFGGSSKVAIKKVALFPALWAVILGILLNAFNVPIGPVLDNVINYLGQGAIPLIMISLGLALNLNGLHKNIPSIAFTSVVKLFIFPLIACIIVSLLHLSGLEYDVAIVEAAMPSGMLSLLLAITYDLDYHVTSDCILSNTLFSLITLPIIISLI